MSDGLAECKHFFLRGDFWGGGHWKNTQIPQVAPLVGVAGVMHESRSSAVWVWTHPKCLVSFQFLFNRNT